MKWSSWIHERDWKRLWLFLLAVAGGGIIVLLLIHVQDIASAGMRVLAWTLNVLTGFIAGLVIAYLLLAVVEWLQRLLLKLPLLSGKEKLARGLAVATTYLLIFFVFFSVLFALVLAITKQVQTINFEDLPRLIQELQVQIVGFIDTILAMMERLGISTDGMEEWLSGLSDNLGGSLTTMGSGVFSFANNVTGFLSNALFAVIFSIYFLYDTAGLMEYWSNAFRAIFGRRVHHVCAVLLSDANTCFSGYIRGQFADAVFMAVALGILLAIVGVPYAVVIGILSGLGNLIPYVGPIVAYGLTIGVCAATGQWGTLLIALLVVLVLQTVDGNVVNPRLLSQSIDVHPVLVIVGLLFGSAMGGLTGMLLAVPVASFLKIQFERLVAWRSGA